MAKAVSKSRCWSLVFNIPNELNIEEEKKQREYLEEIVYKLDTLFIDEEINYYANIHDNDTYTSEDIEYNISLPKEEQRDIEIGMAKKMHLHFIVQYVNARHWTSVLKDFSDYLGIPLNCIQIKQVRDIYKAVQYLTHKNDKLKCQYPYENLFSNDIQKLEYYYNHKEITTIDLYNMVFNYDYTYSQIMLVLDKDNMKKYNNVIVNLIKEREGTFKC